MRGKGARLAGVLAAAAVVLGALGYAACPITWEEGMLYRKVTVLEPEEGQAPASNPLKGWMPWSTAQASEHYDNTLVFALVSWAQLEPEEGCVDFEGVEAALNLPYWRERGVRFVLRLVCDYPDDAGGLDIPQWLYDRIGGDGQWYDNQYGKGFSPNYGNPRLLQAHGALLEQLGAHYDQDPYLAWVQLGSLGHWGEWHVNASSGIKPFPEQVITDRYVRQYLEAFPSKRLLLRRPYAIGGEAGLGLYNDSFAQPQSHDTWLSWIANGYVSDQNGESLAGMPQFWCKAPSGGEFASGREIEDYLGAGLEETRDYIRRSHTTFLGPRCVFDVEDGSCAQAAEELSREMGYTLRVNRCTTRTPLFSARMELVMEWENTGLAPIYENWPIQIRLVDRQGKEVLCQQVDGGIHRWGTGVHRLCCTLEGAENLPRGTYVLEVGILDPITGAPGVALANGGAQPDGSYRMGQVVKG